MEAITVLETRIHCDTCHHEFVGQPTEWHGKPCPECGTEDIITDHDMFVWNGMNMLRKTITEAVGDVADSVATVDITISTKK